MAFLIVVVLKTANGTEVEAIVISPESLEFTGRNPEAQILTMVVAGETKPTLDVGCFTATPPFVAEMSDAVTDVPGGTQYEITVPYSAGERGPDTGALITVVGGVSRVVRLTGRRK